MCGHLCVCVCFAFIKHKPRIDIAVNVTPTCLFIDNTQSTLKMFKRKKKHEAKCSTKHNSGGGFMAAQSQLDKVYMFRVSFLHTSEYRKNLSSAATQQETKQRS